MVTAYNRSFIMALWLIIFGGLYLNACNMPRRAEPTEPAMGYIYTSAAQTVDAQLTGDSGTLVPTGSPSVTSVWSTGTPILQVTTPATTPNPKTLTASPVACDLAEFVKDVTVPDNSEIPPGTSFKKTWRLRNVGSCTWAPAYAIVFEGENVFNAPASVQITTGSVSPGETVDITVDLQSPPVAGRYRQDFKLANPSGEKFGLGEDGSKPFWAQIKVVSESGIVYDFLAKSPEAEWKSGVGDTLDTDLVFGASQENHDGVAKILDGVTLENGSEYGKLLLTFPKHTEDGVVAGVYPSHLVQEGDHLLARLGFLAQPDGTCGSGSVEFQIAYQEGDTFYLLGEWRKDCDGSLIPVKIDLSSLEGENVQFVFLVRAYGSYTDDYAVWNSPRIER